MTLTFEALNAAEGDCLLIHHGPADDQHHIVIDGGVTETWACSLKPRLEQLRDEHHLDPDTPLPIELLVVTHIDNDHIRGVNAMLEELESHPQAAKPWQIEWLWCNTFDADPSTDDLAALRELDPGGAAAIADARTLSDHCVTLDIARNDPKQYFPAGFIARAPGTAPVPLGELTLEVLSPTVKELEDLQKKSWDKAKKRPARKSHGSAAAVTKPDSDTSPPNLSSIIVLVEADGHRMLLPGDAKSEEILVALNRAKIVPEGGTLEVDVFKLPHHGSIRNASTELFERVRAKHYVISADGSNGNPDEATLELLEAALVPGGDQTIWVTFARDAWKDVEGKGREAKERITALQKAQRWLDRQQVKVVYREPDAPGITIPLEGKGATGMRPRKAPTAKKPAALIPTAKKLTGKKLTGKKLTGKKLTGKKLPAKKPPAKRPSVKKPPAKKPPVHAKKARR